MQAFATRLRHRLGLPLPGPEAQFRMASSFRLDPKLFGHQRADVRQSAVLIAIYPFGDVPSTVLIKRPDYDGAHSGQVSFPGGRVEDIDPDLEATALREAHEEVGIHPDGVEVIGRLTELYIPASNFMVHPFVGLMSERPALTPDVREVKEMLEVPLAHFLRPDIVAETEIPLRNGYRLKAPYFDVKGHVVWGATAMMLSELLDVLRDAGLNNP
jgi:8-oxo-dGTP pyrophosphatase MutT (NUDIX family)